jgi:quercetin dioxygenase-like cupin family protein
MKMQTVWIAVTAVALTVAANGGARAQTTAPDAFSVEWLGKHPCEPLYEDAQIRVGRCTFPPGAVHVRHSHPGYLTYILTGGKGLTTTEAGERAGTTEAGTLLQNPPVPWHEYKNVGDTTMSYLVIEKKYQPAPTTGSAPVK